MTGTAILGLDPQSSLILAAALIALPGLFAWWTGRRVLALGDDPALAERFLERRQRLTVVTAVALALLVVLVPEHAKWTIPLTVLALLGGAFPARRALFGETWGFPRYLAFVLRFWLAAGGFWLALLAAPFAVWPAGSFRWLAMAGLGLTLLLWEHFHPAILLRVLGAAPLDRPDLEGRFTSVLARSRTPAPRLYRLGRPGGRWANALALPSFRTPGVLFGETLLDELQPEEVSAILAHEVAHLEHYDRRRLLAVSAPNWLAIAVGVVGVPLALWRFPAYSTAIGWAWVLGLLVFLSLRASGRRAHEADSDRRAVALGGDADALGRALMKLHALSRLPRRWSPEMERGATHPSLARRIQAIGAAGGVQSAALTAPTVARGLTPGCFVILEAERVSWLEGVPEGTPADPATLREHAATVQSVRYSELSELRVRPAGSGPVSLVASGRRGVARSLPLNPDDVASVQAALDLVDVRLGPEAAGRLHHPALASLTASATVLVSMVAVGLSTVLIPGLIAAVRPGPMALVALGATALGEAALTALRFGEPPTMSFAFRRIVTGSSGWAAVGGLAVLGAIALGLGWARVRTAPESRRSGAMLVTAPLAALAVLAWVSLGWTAGLDSPLRWLHEGARGMPSAALAPLGLGAALVASGRRGWVRAGGVLLVAALLPVLMGSAWVGGRIARDPLSAAAPAFELTDAVATPLSQAVVELPAWDLRLSPSGLRFAVRQSFATDADDEDGPDAVPTTFRVGTFTGPTAVVEAQDLVFLDDDRALALVRDGPEWRVELHELAPPNRVSWRVVVPELGLARLSVEPASRRWALTGFDARSSEIVAISGVVGHERPDVIRWKRPGGESQRGAVRGWELLAYAPATRTAMILTTEYRTGFLPWSLLLPLPPAWREVWTLGPRGASRLAASDRPLLCPRGFAGEPSRVCITYGPRATGFWSAEADPGRISVLGSVAGPVTNLTAGPGGRLAGWTADRSVLVIDSAARVATRLRLPDEAGRPRWLYPMPARLGTLTYGRSREATIALWEIR